MIVKFLINLFVILITCNISHAAGVWTNEPVGSTRVLDCDFVTTTCNGKYIRGTFWNLYNSNVGEIDNTDPISPPSIVAARLNYTSGCGTRTPSSGGTYMPCATGGFHLEWFDSQTTNKELYVGLYFKTSTDYYCSLTGTSKVWFLRQFDNSSDSNRSNGVFLINGCGNIKGTEFSHNSGTVDDSHTCAKDLGLTCYPNVGSGSIPNNTWVRWEGCIRASSTFTSRDGVLWWSINGVMAGKYTNYNYQGVNEVVLNQTWDGYGNGQGFQGETAQKFAHMIISVPPNGGCASVVGGSTPPPPSSDNPVGPPSAPLNLQAS